jgi:transcriptional regulator with XRE-family HTH domain
MQHPATNFDRYLARLRADARFDAEFAAADQAWDIALQLAALRQARGLTQKQVAELLDTKQQAIARLEDPAYTGHSLTMVRRYVEALGASLQINIVPASNAADHSSAWQPGVFPATGAGRAETRVRDASGNYDVRAPEPSTENG